MRLTRTEVDVDAVVAAAGAVLDPELDQPLADLGMLGEVSLRRGGRVDITV